MDKCKYVIFCDQGLLIISIIIDSVCIGKAKLTLHERHASLRDIIIFDNVPISSSWLRSLLGKPKRKSFRGLGFGTMLLKNAIEQLKLKNIDTLTGEMSGDITRLTKWYSENGFDVDIDSRKILMRIRRV